MSFTTNISFGPATKPEMFTQAEEGNLFLWKYQQLKWYPLCKKYTMKKKTKTNMDSYTTEIKSMLAYWDSPRQYGFAVLGLVAQLCPILCDPMDCSPPGSSVHGDFPDKNTEVGCHAILQGIFPTKGLNPGLLHCRQILYHLSHQGSPIWV